jgi:hypothetical protein
MNINPIFVDAATGAEIAPEFVGSFQGEIIEQLPPLAALAEGTECSIFYRQYTDHFCDRKWHLEALR